MKILLVLISLACFTIEAQNRIEYNPRLPINPNDTIVILAHRSITKEVSEKIIVFSLKHKKLSCNSLNLVHHLFKPSLKVTHYEDATYKDRNMDVATVSRKTLKKYKTIKLKNLLKYSKGTSKRKYYEAFYECVRLEIYLNQITVYYDFKDDGKHVLYEVLPVILF